MRVVDNNYEDFILFKVDFGDSKLTVRQVELFGWLEKLVLNILFKSVSISI